LRLARQGMNLGFIGNSKMDERTKELVAMGAAAVEN
jgi:hypothetical protein